MFYNSNVFLLFFYSDYCFLTHTALDGRGLELGLEHLISIFKRIVPERIVFNFFFPPSFYSG